MYKGQEPPDAVVGAGGLAWVPQGQERAQGPCGQDQPRRESLAHLGKNIGGCQKLSSGINNIINQNGCPPPKLIINKISKV